MGLTAARVSHCKNKLSGQHEPVFAGQAGLAKLSEQRGLKVMS